MTRVPEKFKRRCRNCFGLLKRYYGAWQPIFCSNWCQAAHGAITRIEQAEKAGDFSVVTTQPTTIRRLFSRIRPHKCEKCGLTSWNGKPAPLVLDHIDGNSDNWKIINLRFLCCNCDAQTDTYKGKNRGNGRHSRRQRYAQGKSY